MYMGHPALATPTLQQGVNLPFLSPYLFFQAESLSHAAPPEAFSDEFPKVIEVWNERGREEKEPKGLAAKKGGEESVELWEFLA